MEAEGSAPQQPATAPSGAPAAAAEAWSGSQACWPDHLSEGRVVLDDVSQLSETEVRRLFMPRSLDDIRSALEWAAREGLTVSCRGAKHSMGGHSIAGEGVVLDMAWISHIDYDAQSGVVKCGAGTIWSDLIVALNRHGKAPRTLQSYCSFSVGGSLSVNAHGITTDYCLAESIVALTVCRLDETGEFHALRCTADNEHSKLFRHAIGGYGLFGVIYEVEMRVDDNSRVSMESIHCSPADFLHVYSGLLQAPEDEVVIKLGRIDITSFDWIAVYVFKRECKVPTVSDLPFKPREMSAASRLMYKWLAGPLMELRFARERSSGVALDWSAVTDRNTLLFESAEPLARLYNPILHHDDTFILQEFFVPFDGFAHFYRLLQKTTLEDIAGSSLVTLLNATIRFVRSDTISALPYAPKDSFAFVLYYRLRRNAEAEGEMERFHKTLAEGALSVGGTFYLPYRHHYTHEQLQRGYAAWPAFVAAKAELDPIGMFSNMWWRHYAGDAAKSPREVQLKAKDGPASPPQAAELNLSDVSLHRQDSFRRLMQDARHRQMFRDDFLVHTLSILSNNVVFNAMARCCWDVRNKNDDEIYHALRTIIKRTTAGPFSKLMFLFNSIRQISAQRAELTRETLSVISRLGKLGAIRSYCSIGDAGKLCLSLKRHLSLQRCTVVHDKEGAEDDVATVLERGSMEPVGEFVHIDYDHLRERELPELGDESFDLVTMNQGLHHLPPAKLPAFLAAIKRVLRPGGLFIVREHDMRDESLRPVLDCAHMVFNAVTGVELGAEQGERRGFRSVAEWRRIVESCTGGELRDTMVYEMQPNDATWDVMMCFCKEASEDAPRDIVPGLMPSHGDGEQEVVSEEAPPLQAPVESAGARVAAALPKIALDAGMGLVNTLLKALPTIRTFLVNTIKLLLSGLPGVSEALAVNLTKTFDGYLSMLERFQPLADAATPAKGEGPSFVPDELFLIVPILRVRAKNGGVLESAVVAVYDNVVEAMSSSTPVPTKSSAGNSEKVSGAASNASEGKGSNDDNENDNQEFAVTPEEGAMSAAEFDDELHKLVLAIPELYELETVIEEAGLGSQATSLLIAGATPEKLAQARAWLLQNLDERSWKALLPALQAACEQGEKPTLGRMTTTGAPWNRVALALLGCPAVQLSFTQTVGMQTMGLGALVSLWKSAQSQRKADSARDPGTLSTSDLLKVRSAMEGLAPTVKKQFTLGAKKLKDLTNVLCVERAELHANSLTLLLSNTTTDVTQEVCDVLDAEEGVLGLSNLKLGGFQNTWRAGKHWLEVHYRELPSIDRVKDSSQQLVQSLDECGVIDATWRAANGPFTWLKLPEWMQAETVQLFGNSMNHTPFYRFPFIKALLTYIDVLSKETRIVAAQYGWATTLLGDAFITDFVGAIIMGIGFGALALAAAPIKAVTGDSYPEETLREKVLLTAPRGVEWTDLCGEDSILAVQELVAGVWSLTIPTFKGFTPALMKIATEVPAATLVNISNQAVVQTRLSLTVSSDAEAQRLAKQYSTMLGCTEAVQFAFPAVGGRKNPVQLCLNVEVPHLLNLLRACAANPEKITVHQVYDFYCYD